MYFITTKRMLEVCFSAHPNIQYRTFFLYIEDGDLCAERVTIHGPAEKRSSANSNTLRDAQKRQKTPFRAV